VISKKEFVYIRSANTCHDIFSLVCSTFQTSCIKISIPFIIKSKQFSLCKQHAPYLPQYWREPSNGDRNKF